MFASGWYLPSLCDALQRIRIPLPRRDSLSYSVLFSGACFICNDAVALQVKHASAHCRLGADESASHSASLQSTSQLTDHTQEHCIKLSYSFKSSTTHLLRAETAKEDSIAQGAAALLRAQSLFRAVSRQPSALAGLVAALMAGSQYNSPKAQQAILDCYLMFALRFIRPPQLARAQVRFTYACLLDCLHARLIV